MSTTVNSNATGGGGGLSLTSAQITAGATGVIASDSAGNAYKQDGTAFSGGGGSIPTTTAILKGNGSGGAAAATAGTDYASVTTTAGLLKADGAGNAVHAAAGTDYPSIAVTTNLLQGDGAGNAVASAVAGLGQLIGVNTQPFGIAPSGATIGANGGALTLTTAFIETYGPTGGIPYDGIWLWFEAGATDTGSSAGFYWTVMTSTTAGTVNNNFLSPGNTALNKPPASVTPYTTNVGKVGTAGTTSQILGLIFPTLAAGALGANGHMTLEMSQRSNVSAGLKQLQPKLVMNGSGSNCGPVLNSIATSSNVEATVRVFNKNNASRQGATPVCTTSTAVVTGAPTGAAGATGTQTTTMGVDLKLATSTDWVVCQFAALKAWPSA